MVIQTLVQRTHTSILDMLSVLAHCILYRLPKKLRDMTRSKKDERSTWPDSPSDIAHDGGVSIVQVVE